MGKRRVAEIAGIGLGLSLALDVRAAGRRSQESTLTRIEILLSDAKNRTDALDLEYRSRGGLLGGEEAEERYQEGVYLFLLGSYEPAAMNFYALVQSEALSDIGKHQDAEWYLAESLYEMQNYQIANEFYVSISDRGPSHLFFEDAVRKQLDVHAVLDDETEFVRVYDRYIGNGRVEQTDSLAYTLGKSFYRRGKIQQAKMAFMQIGNEPGQRDTNVCEQAAKVSALENEYLGKACYFMGVMNSLGSQGDLEAASNAFAVVAEIADQDPRITEQAILALARIAKEEGRYTAATAYYQQVSNDSDHLDIKLYELIYTFIDQGQWSEALRDVDIFLTAFPDHRKAAQLRLLKGHLHMKKSDSSELAHKAPEQERAHNAYLALRERSTPVREMLSDVASNSEDLESIFANVVKGVDVYQSSAYSLPPYAVEMLVGNPDVSLVVDLTRDMDQQDADVEFSVEVIDEVQQALDVSQRSVGTFNQGRLGLTRVRDDAIYIQQQLLSAELEFLESRLEVKFLPELRALRDKISVLEERSIEVLGSDREEPAISKELEQQFERLRAETSEIELNLRENEAVVIALQRRLDQQPPDASPAEQAEAEATRQSLTEVQAQVESDTEALESLRVNLDRLKISSTVGLGSSSDTDKQRDYLLGDYSVIQRQLRTYRAEVTGSDAPQIFSRIDGIGVEAARLDQRARAIREVLERIEGDALSMLETTLASETIKVSAIQVDLKKTNRSVDKLATDVTGAGFVSLERELYEVIMNADRGIAEVFWVRKTEVNARIKELLGEQSRRKAELHLRFAEIEKTLDEQ